MAMPRVCIIRWIEEGDMKEYMVRLHDWRGVIVDGEFYNASSEEQALMMYRGRARRLGIAIGQGYYFTVQEV